MAPFRPHLSPSVCKLLETNTVPSVAEHDEIVEILRQGNVQILNLEELIARLQSLRQDIKSKMQRYSSVISAVRRLPAEILATIFALCLEHPTLSRWKSHKSQDTIWNVSQVCKYWRDVALSSGELWSRFNVVAGLWRSKHSDGRLRYIQKLQLERASRYPLTVSMDLHDDPDRPSASSHPLVEQLLRASDRWHVLRLFTNLPSLERLLPPEISFLNLRKLMLGAWTTGVNDLTSPSPIQTFSNCPHLRYLGAHSNTIRHFDIPWTQVTTYSGPNYTGSIGSNDMHIDALKRMSNLTFCQLRCDDIIRSPFVPEMPVLLPHLRSLSLSRIRDFDSDDADVVSKSCAAVNQFLRLLTLPALEELEICSDPNPGGVITLLKRSECKLVGLRLPYLRSPEMASLVMRILRSVPSLKELHLSADESSEMNHFVELLHAQEDCAPSLVHLMLEGPRLVEDWIRGRIGQRRPSLRVSISAPKRNSATTLTSFSNPFQR